MKPNIFEPELFWFTLRGTKTKNESPTTIWDVWETFRWHRRKLVLNFIYPVILRILGCFSSSIPHFIGKSIPCSKSLPQYYKVVMVLDFVNQGQLLGGYSFDLMATGTFLELQKGRSYLGFGCFQEWWYPQIIHFNRVFYYKPSILGYQYPYFWKHPFGLICLMPSHAKP